MLTIAEASGLIAAAVMISMFQLLVLLLLMPDLCRNCADDGCKYNTFCPLP